MDQVTGPLANKAVMEPKLLTAAEVRRLRGLEMTVRNPNVIACGHRLSPLHPPRMRNCLHCWMAFFDAHPELLGTIDRFVKEHGLEALIPFHGRRFVKYFGLYNQFVRANGKIAK